MKENIVVNHDFQNRLHTVLLLLSMLALLGLLGWLIGGAGAIIWAVLLGAIAMFVTQRATPQTILRMYKAQPLSVQDAPALYQIVNELARRANLPSPPQLYYIPSAVLNAFAVGNRANSAIGLTDGLLRRLDLRELTGVLAHEMSHVRNHDMRVMGLADAISRVTSVFSSFGKFLLLFNLPLILMGRASISWWAILLLIIAPVLIGLLQLALSRTRELDADLDAVQLTHDPVGLSNALRKLEYYSQNWLQQILFPGAGVPGPSILRTHPHTADRLARLAELSDMEPEPLLVRPRQAILYPTSLPRIDRRPTWNAMGIWY
ncbi:MAG: zinc metalloprotease HtpX [Caldilineaceae bacterium]